MYSDREIENYYNGLSAVEKAKVDKHVEHAVSNGRNGEKVRKMILQAALLR